MSLLENKVGIVTGAGQGIGRAIARRFVADGGTVIEENDTVFFLAAQRNIRTMMKELRPLDNPVHRIILAGGGNIGSNLARQLERNHHVKIIERDPERAETIAETLEKAIVLVGDCADEELLREEAIDTTDVYCVLTNDDEANILSSMLAKRMGAEKVIAIINRPSYVDLVESSSIDIAVSPQQITIGALLTHIRRGNMVRIHSLRRGAAEAIEAVAMGDKRSSRVVGRAIEDIDLQQAGRPFNLVRYDGNEIRSTAFGNDVFKNNLPAVALAGLTAAEPDDVAPAGSILALRAAPNPFNPRSRIRFVLAHAAVVHLEVHDLAGRKVVTLISAERREAGRHAAVWDGTDSRGRALASGVYFAKLTVGGETDSAKMIMLK